MSEIKLQKAKQSTTKLGIEEKLQLQETRRELTLQAKANGVLSSTYDKLNAQRTIAQKRLGDLLSAEKLNNEEITFKSADNNLWTHALFEVRDIMFFFKELAFLIFVFVYFFLVCKNNTLNVFSSFIIMFYKNSFEFFAILVFWIHWHF